MQLTRNLNHYLTQALDQISEASSTASKNGAPSDTSSCDTRDLQELHGVLVSKISNHLNLLSTTILERACAIPDKSCKESLEEDDEQQTGPHIYPVAGLTHIVAAPVNHLRKSRNHSQLVFWSLEQIIAARTYGKLATPTADAEMPAIWGIDYLLGLDRRRLHDVPKQRQQKDSLASCAATNSGVQLCSLIKEMARTLPTYKLGK